MVPELSEAAKDATIKDALINKISRERIGTEVDKMLSGPSPFLSLQLIHQYGLYPTVFTSPSGVPLSQPPEDASQAVSAVGAVQWLLRETTDSSLRTTANKEERRNLYLAAALLPYLSVMSEVKNRPIHAVQLVLRDSLKAPNHDVNTVSTLFRGVPLFQQAVHRLDQQHTISRSELGLLIRDIGALWQPCLKLALVQDLLQQPVAWALPDTLDTHLDAVSGLLASYERLLEQAYHYDIQEAHTWRPMIDVSLREK
jgi:tRNA nucleotidyltransferase (CCA-adding enzyme)